MAIKPQEKAVPRGAQKHRVGHLDRSRGWFRHHIEVALQALVRLTITPVATLMTLAVLAIALALPGFLFTVVNNIQQFSIGWDTNPRIMLYLNTEVEDARAEQLSLELMLHGGLSGVELIDRDQGLREFSSYSEFAGMLSLLDSNPLPAVILVLPADHHAAALQQLQAELQSIPEVSEAVLDLEWIQRLNAYLLMAERFSWVLAGLLALAVLLVVGNTIRMTLESRRDEILVAKLVGATDAWVRRPFLYSGFWYGLIGSLFAYVLVQVSLYLITGPANQLAQLYSSNFVLQGLDLTSGLTLIATGTGLGVLGGFLSTGRHLRAIEPS
ncbi:permease-like cell division protein FtsX [Nitrincola schmidtii]|uniref:permease-like cell division protein FtsX n=1 Tax=Nitrincola schmidtii TaxID=1730894 RepID=UPI00124D383E|nr:permease-like cell division protein FtsX [Nitrincola schmidtii]